MSSTEVTAPNTLVGVPVDRVLAAQLRRAGRKAKESVTERDRLICDAVAAGGSLREVGELVGLSHQAVKLIARKAAG